MRYLPQPRLAAVFGVVLTFAALAAGAGRPAAAQVVISNKAEPIGSVRAGAYFPFNDQVKNVVGKTFFDVGLDYFVQRQPMSRTVLSLDYIERNSGGHKLRIFPLTIGQFTYQGSSGGVRPYLGFGVGAYFVHSDFVDDSGNPESNDATVFGGFLAGGVDFQNNIFVEARYHAMERVGSAKPDGLQLAVGYRF